MPKVMVAAIQVRPAKTLVDLANVEKAVDLAAEAARSGAQIACFPELFPYHGEKEIAAAARRHGLYVIAGLVEAVAGREFSTATLFGPDGRLIGRQRKVHVVFNVEHFDAGHEYTVFNTDFGRIGMLLCFDGWACPDGLFHLARQGMDLFFNPCLMFKKKPQRRMALLTHVLEYKVPIIAPNNARWSLKVRPEDPERPPEGGGSLIVAPPPFFTREALTRFMNETISCEEWIIREAGVEEEILTASFDIEALRDMRAIWDDCLGACIVP